ncbi:MAG: SUMF1/EgtB/PvdO family nonheme iron enzyme, partial [Chloroflexota bacterium]
MALLETVISAIIELAVQKPIEKAAGAAQRRETVVRVLKRVGLNPDRPPADADFDTLYAYTLVEWGVDMPRPVLDFFRQEAIQAVFRRAYYEQNPALLEREAEEIIDWNRETGRLKGVDYDPRRQFAAFTAVFNHLVNQSRPPAAVQDHHLLQSVHQTTGDLHHDLGQLQAQLRQLPTLAEVRQVIAEMTPGVTADSEALRPYLDMVARRSSRLPLSPLDPGGRDGGHFSLAKLFVNLDAGPVYKFLEKEIAVYDSALAHVHDQERFILLGDPGSGKSTLLRLLAWGLAEANLRPDGGWRKVLQWPVTIQKEGQGDARERLLPSPSQGEGPGERIYLPSPSQGEGPGERVNRPWTAATPIPVYVELRHFAATRFDPASPLALWHFVAAQLKAEELDSALPVLQSQAQRGRVLFLLDGVDEVPAAQRPLIWQAIYSLANGPYGGNRWLATCRVLSFDQQEAPAGAPVQTLRPFNPAQIEQFITNWYAVMVDVGEKGRKEGEALARALRYAAKGALNHLAANPMLLTIMALVQTYHGTLPEQRAKLYQACVETLLLRWQRHKETGKAAELPDLLARLGVSKENLERLLWELGWQAQSQAPEGEQAADLPAREVLEVAQRHLGSYGRAEQFLEYTEQRAHLLIGRGGRDQRFYTFPHRTFQEYLAAGHLAAQRRFGRRAAELAAQGPAWRETLNLAAGALVFNQNNREKALDGVAQVLPAQTPAAEDEAGWRRVWLAAEMAVVIGRADVENDEVGQELLPRLRQQLAALLNTGRLPPRQRAEAGDALAQLGDERPGVCTLEPDLIEIPAGPFLMGDKPYEIHLEAFAIARYPVTNAQFRFFVQDHGYTERWRHCWTPEGWGYCQHYGWTQPRFWNDPQWSQPNQPVVGVSWYEAVAYANWLNEKTGRARAQAGLPTVAQAGLPTEPAGGAVRDRPQPGWVYRLPTEAEWERAARHTDGRQYPWVGDWVDGLINSEEIGLQRTTAVGCFPQGAAHCGAQDMSGNVWEWCRTRWRDEKGKDYPLPYRPDDGRESLAGGEDVWRVVRGGSYWNGRATCGCSVRNWNYPL